MAAFGGIERTGNLDQDVASEFAFPLFLLFHVFTLLPLLVGLGAMFKNWSQTHFSATSAADASPLYASLCAKIADDKEVLLVALEVAHLPMPLLFFASVQYHLALAVDHPLRNYFATFTDSPLPFSDETYQHFREFVLANREALLPMLRTRLVQTNEVRRCALFLPALQTALQRGQLKEPFAFIEIGSSAGLNLNMMHYTYEFVYPDGRTVSIGESSGGALRMQCHVRDNSDLPLPSKLPRPTHRIGIDLLPLDVRDADCVRWLSSLIWPEHRERRERLTAAVEVARQHPVQHLAGDAVEKLREAFSLVPASSTIVVLHSFVLNQFPAALLQALTALMKELSHTRSFVEIGCELSSTEVAPLLILTHWQRGESSSTPIAECSAHGRWIQMRKQQEIA